LLRHPVVSVLVIAAALALHAAVAWLLGQRAVVAPTSTDPVAARISLRWLPPQRQVSPVAEATTVRPETDRATRRKRELRTPVAPHEQRAPAVAKAAVTDKDTAPTPTQTTSPATPNRRATAPATAAVPAQPTAQPKGGWPMQDILSSPGTRRAIRDAALAPSLADLDGTTSRASTTQQLGAAIASGARGDCDKGEFAGGGMGLLSLPFWAIARLRDHCGK